MRQRKAAFFVFMALLTVYSSYPLFRLLTHPVKNIHQIAPGTISPPYVIPPNIPAMPPKTIPDTKSLQDSNF
jgi:hypothetical protein